MAPTSRKPLAATQAAPALLVGVLAVQWLPVLPPAWLSILLLLPVAVLSWRWPRWRLPACFCAGALWAMHAGAAAIDGAGGKIQRREHRRIGHPGGVEDRTGRRRPSGTWILRGERQREGGREERWNDEARFRMHGAERAREEREQPRRLDST